MRTLRILAISACVCLSGAAFAQAPDSLAPQSLAPVPTTPAASAGQAAMSPTSSPDGQPHELEATDLNAWLDGFMPYALKAGDIPGAEIVVVKDGQVLTARGYGVSDSAQQKPVNPATTLFRPGSISKTVTWTAVMQLVEAGKIDLDRDVNTYLDFKLPAYDGKPVTMRELMTHTAGFEEKVKYLIIADPKRPMNLETYLKAAVPARIFAPFTVGAYSNYGAALAGYIVQRLSGESFDDYTQHHIFTPLGMLHSTMAQPLPAALVPDMSQGYQYGLDEPQHFEFVTAAPAGSLTTSGADMARFMMMQLGGGTLDGVQILQPATAHLMHYSTQYTDVPNLPGMALGFYHEDQNGLVIIGHAGDTNYFHSDLHLLLDKNVGFYMSMNSGGRDGIAELMRTRLFRSFVDRYYPTTIPPEPTTATAAAHAQLMAGTYVSSRRFDTNFLRMLPLLQPSKVTALPNGDISFTDFRTVGGAVKKWHEVRPFIWREVGGQSLLAAKIVDGHVDRFSSDDLPPVFAFYPAPFWAKTTLLLLFSIGVLVVAGFLWPVSAVLRRHYKAPLGIHGADLFAYHATGLGALIDVACVAGLALFVSALSQDVSATDGHLDPLLRVIQVLAGLGFLTAIVACWNCINAWRHGWRGWWSRLGTTALAIAAVAFAWFVFVLNIITPALTY